MFELEDEDFNTVDGLWRTLPEGGEGRRANNPRVHVGFDIFNEEIEEPVGG